MFHVLMARLMAFPLQVQLMNPCMHACRDEPSLQNPWMRLFCAQEFSHMHA